jgi:hypothetical protein
VYEKGQIRSWCVDANRQFPAYVQSPGFWAYLPCRTTTLAVMLAPEDALRVASSRVALLSPTERQRSTTLIHKHKPRWAPNKNTPLHFQRHCPLAPASAPCPLVHLLRRMFPSRCFLVVLLVVIELSVANNNLCPPGYWGSMCKPCEACTVGNGACDGDGRGTGTGKCICEKAWLGSTCNLTSCFGKVISVPHDFLAFAACSTIKGPLVINATSLLDVEPLAHVHTIAGVDETGNSISIYDNANLLNVTGLRGLRKLAGAVVVDKNPMLE